MDALIKLLSRALAVAVRGKGKIITAKANTKCATSYNKLTRIELRIERLERFLQNAREDHAKATECLNASKQSLREAQVVQAHYEERADAVLGLYPSAIKAVDEEDPTETLRYNKFYNTYERIPTKE